MSTFSLKGGFFYILILGTSTEKDGGYIHFTTIPGKPNTANSHTEFESHIFCEIRSCTNNIMYVRFKVLRTFLCLLRVFVR